MLSIGPHPVIFFSSIQPSLSSDFHQLNPATR
jgi:hypothetical protein